MTDKQPHVNETPDSVAIGKEDVNNTQSDVNQGETRSTGKMATPTNGYTLEVEKTSDVASLHAIDIVDNLIHSITRRHIPDYPEATLAINKIDALIAQRVAEAQTNAVAWSVGVIDELHTNSLGDIDRTYKGIKNTLRARYKSETGVDPAPNYPVKATLTKATKGKTE